MSKFKKTPITMHKVVCELGLAFHPKFVSDTCANCDRGMLTHNAYPSRKGKWFCAQCIGDDGFYSVKEYEEFPG